MNYIFITIITVICFFCLLAVIHSIVTMIERRKMIDAFCKMYSSLGIKANSDGMNIDEIIAAVKKTKG